MSKVRNISPTFRGWTKPGPMPDVAQMHEVPLADGDGVADADLEEKAGVVRSEYRAVFMDWRMPSMDGLTASGRIKQSANRAHDTPNPPTS